MRYTVDGTRAGVRPDSDCVICQDENDGLRIGAAGEAAAIRTQGAVHGSKAATTAECALGWPGCRRNASQMLRMHNFSLTSIFIAKNRYRIASIVGESPSWSRHRILIPACEGSSPSSPAKIENPVCESRRGFCFARLVSMPWRVFRPRFSCAGDAAHSCSTMSGLLRLACVALPLCG